MEKRKAYSGNAVFEIEAAALFNEYYDLTGRNFPPCSSDGWSSLSDWFTDLKLAVYRQRALRDIYGDTAEREGAAADAFGGSSSAGA